MASEPTARGMMMAIRGDPSLVEAIQKDPIKGLEQAEEQARSYSMAGDQFIYRAVVGVLGATLLITLVGVLVLAFLQIAAPNELIALGSAALGALAGLLAPSPTRTPDQG